MKFVASEPDHDNCYATIRSNIASQSPGSIDTSEVIDLFKSYGTILFRGFDTNPDSLNELTSRFCSSFVMNKLRGRVAISEDGRTQSVNLHPVAFPLHPEMSQVPWRPDIAWFACLSPPSKNGETTLCDGIKIVDKLNEVIRSRLEHRSFLYRKKATLEEFEFWTGLKDPYTQDLDDPALGGPYRFSIQDGALLKSFTTPVLYHPMFSNKLAFGSFLLFRRLLHNDFNSPKFEDGSNIPNDLFNAIKTVSDDLTIEHRWEKGDILMIDNTRFMHGRNAIDNQIERRIITQFGYASFRQDMDALKESQPWRHNPSMLLSPHMRL